MKYLPPVSSKMVPKLKVWHIRYFECPDLDFNAKNYFLSNIYPLLRPDWR